MPARDGTGPMGTGPRGRRMGPCRNTAAGTQAPDTIKETTDGEIADSKTPVVYGTGRSGKPRGCGRGFCGGNRT